MKASLRHKKNLLKQFNYRCAYCGSPITASSMTLDHVYPKCYGGRRSERNIRPSCFLCNSVKANLSIEGFRKRIKLWKNTHQWAGSKLANKYKEDKIEFYFEQLDRERQESDAFLEKVFADINGDL